MKNKLKKIFTMLFLSLITVTVFADANSNIDQLIKDRVDKKYNVDIVVATIDAKATKFYSSSDKLSQNTLFPIASITKVFTTLLLADGIQKKIFVLDDPAQKYLSNVTLPKYGTQQITLENLATHTSGLPVRFNNIVDDADPYMGLNNKDFIELLNSSKLTKPPGKNFEYSDIGIGLLGMIIANQNHASYDNLVANIITKPLGMNSTKVINSSGDQEITIQGHNAEDLPVKPYHFPILAPAGAIYSTAADLAKFIAANLGLTKSDLYSAMQLTHIPRLSEGKANQNFDYPGIENLNISLGWNIDKKYGLVWKNGNMSGFSSFIGFNEKTKQGVVILANAGNVIYTDNLGLHLLNNKIKLLPLYQEIKINSAILNTYAGKYLAADGTYYILQAEGNHLKAQHFASSTGSPFFNIYPSANNQFFGRVSDSVFTFVTEKQRGIGFILAENGKQLRAWKTVPLRLN